MSNNQAKYDRLILPPSRLLEDVVKTDLYDQMSRTMTQPNSRQAVVKALSTVYYAAAASYCLLRQQKVKTFLVRGDKALGSGVSATWREGDKTQNGQITVESLMRLLIQREEDQDVQVLHAEAPRVARENVVSWQAVGMCTWISPRRLREGNLWGEAAGHAYFHAWDYANAPLTLLDPDYGQGMFMNGINFRRALLTPNPRFLHECKLIAKADRSGTKDLLVNVAASAMIRHYREEDDGSYPPSGILIVGERHNKDPVPKWAKTSLSEDKRWRLLRAAIIKELRQDLYGSGLFSDRSQRELLSLEERPNQEHSELADHDLDLDVKMAMSNLRDRDSKIIQLSYSDDLTDAEIGQALGISRQAVTKARNKALTLLKSALQ